MIPIHREANRWKGGSHSAYDRGPNVCRAWHEMAPMSNHARRVTHNPLQGLIQTVFLVGRGGAESGLLVEQAMGDLTRLSDLVKQLLSPAGRL
jgi:hypothetical protein